MNLLSVQKCGRQNGYADQDPGFHRKWLEEIAKNGVKSEMGDILDEPGALGVRSQKAQPA